MRLSTYRYECTATLTRAGVLSWCTWLLRNSQPLNSIRQYQFSTLDWSWHFDLYCVEYAVWRHIVINLSQSAFRDIVLISFYTASRPNSTHFRGITTDCHMHFVGITYRHIPHSLYWWKLRHMPLKRCAVHWCWLCSYTHEQQLSFRGHSLAEC